MDDIAVEAIEKNIIAKLEDILSPIKVTYMPDDEVTSVAGESEESRARRKQLENQVDVLVSGADTCKRFMGVRLQGPYTYQLSCNRTGLFNVINYS